MNTDTQDIFDTIFREETGVSVFTNGDLGLQMRTILNEDGSISVNAEDTAIGFGWVDTSQRATSGSVLIKVRWARMNKYSAECGFAQKK